MPARRKPTAILEATGAFAKNPQRRREREFEPVSNGDVGDPPEHLHEGQALIWQELRGEAAPNVLQKSDRMILEMTSILLHRYRYAPQVMPKWLDKVGEMLRARKMPARKVDRMKQTIFSGLQMHPSEVRVLVSCLGCMGMNPRDRLN